MAWQYYHSDGQMDNGIRRILRDNLPNKMILPLFDVIVIDETQDMTKLYFLLLSKMISDANRIFLLLILGDKKQGLYDFKGADIRFLTLASDVWGPQSLLLSPRFVHCTLQISYRITTPMSHFVNKIMLGEHRLEAVKPGIPVVYIRKEKHNLLTIIVAQITNMLSKGFVYSDFYILAGSLKGSFVKQLENRLVERNIPCYLSTMETQELDKRIIENKIVFCTFHAAKGRQCPIVFVLGCNESYFTHLARNLCVEECPNTLYVACTRATHKLFLIEQFGHEEDRPLPFLKASHADMMKPEVDFVDFQGIPTGLRPQKKERTSSPKHFTSPTEIIKFISESTLDIISPIIDRLFIQKHEKLEEIDIPCVKETHTGHFEDVSDINGIILPILFYDRFTQSKKTTLQALIQCSMTELSSKHKYLHEMISTMPTECETISDYLFMANLYISTQEKLYSKLKQIQMDEYDWLDGKVIGQCIQRLDTVLGPNCQTSWCVEKTIIHQSSDIDHFYIDQLLQTEKIYRFTARVDFMSTDSIWELKCTSHLTMDHKLQLILYVWLWNMKQPDVETHKKGVLYNIKTGEHLELVYTMNDLSQIVLALINDKKQIPMKTDEQFLNDLIS